MMTRRSNNRCRRRRPVARRWASVISALCILVMAFRAPHSDALVQAAETDAWVALDIPSAWKRAPRDSGADQDGYGWYRCAVVVPQSWNDRSVELFVEGIDDARECYFNGTSVGRLGEFPPRFRSGLGQSRRFAIPASLLKPDAVNHVELRTYKQNARSNFNVAAPVLFAGDQAIRLKGTWQFCSGEQKPADATAGESTTPVFREVSDATAVAANLRKLEDQKDDGRLSPAESAARIAVPDDLKLDLVLSDPVIGQPLSMKWDARGRLWLVEYLQYPNPAGLKMVSRDKYLRTVYDKVPPAPPHHFRGADKISIHEDTDGDGRYDKHQTFVEGLNLVSSMAIGRGGVWVLNPPYLLFYPDRDGDDVPDGDPIVHLEGFGIEDSHSIANSLRWGPDGWLYGAQGSTVTGNIRRPGIKDRPHHSMGQLIWRYHPESRRYEVFAEGGGNAFGVEIDSQGRLYSGHNGGDTRGFHYVPGGYFRKGFGKHGELSNPYAFGYFPHMEHHQVPRFTHTFVIYEGGTLPGKYDGKLFGVGPLQSHVVYSEIAADGSTFKTKDLGHPLISSDTWVRPVDIQVGPDGAIYVADFYEQRIDHASHYQGRVDKTSGRVYRLRSRTATPGQAAFDYSNATSAELVKLLEHDNKWHRQTALRLLADRGDRSVVPALRERLFGDDAQSSLEALWALHQLKAWDAALREKLLRHDDPYIRLWTIRLICDDGGLSPEQAAALTRLTLTEPNVEVRCQLACSAKRLPAEQSLPIVAGLLQRSEDRTDKYIPLLLWWAIESKCEADREAVLRMLADADIWQRAIVQEHLLERLMRRFAQAGKRADLLTCAELLELAPTDADKKKLLAGFEKSFAGRSLGLLPEELVAAIARAGGGSLTLRLRQSEPEALEQALRIVADEKANSTQRLSLVQILGQIDQPKCVPVLLGLVARSKHEPIKLAALSALQAYDDEQIGQYVVKLLPGMSSNERETAQSLLSSRAAWSLTLLNAVDQGKMGPALLNMSTLRKVLLHRQPEVQKLIAKHWGKIQGSTSDAMLQDIARYRKWNSIGSGDPYRGQKLFGQSCAKCHVLFGQGGYVGPDLTSYRRDDLERMLLNIVNPSIEIREGFENYVVYTLDGRILGGFIAEQDDKIVVLKSTDGQTTPIARDDIDELRAVPQSVMPEGLLSNLDEQQVRDLFAYLRSTQPLP